MRIFIATLLTFALSNANAIPAEGHQLMISAPNPYAVEIGRKIALKGGNVVDVAVAVGLTLVVTAPYYASLGGGGFAVVKMKDKVQAIDFREKAPAATGRDYYKNLPPDASENGGHAIAVPGFAAGLWELHQKYGKLKWEQLFEGPLELASKGFAVSGAWAKATRNQAERFNPAGLKTFFNKGKPYLPGETMRQAALSQALQLFRAKNLKGFYAGPVAADLVKSVQAAGGKMSAADLAAYKVRWLEPLTTDYEGYKIYLMPPPSSGGIVIWQALKMIEKMKVKEAPLMGAEEYHLLAEIEARSFRGRELLGDPDFHKNPIKFLTSTAYLDEMTNSIDRLKHTLPKPLLETDVKESNETTHFSVMDAEGHAIALTVTLNGTYGSGVVSDKYGIAFNNEMDDFTAHPGKPNMYSLTQGPGNEVEAGKRPLSSMSPTLVEKDGKIIMAIGAPGGPRIITAVLQGLYRVLGRGMDVDAAAQAPRVHHQFSPDLIYIDKDKLAPEVLSALHAKGHKTEESFMAKLYIVRLLPNGILEAAFDSRGEGGVGGF